MYNEKKGKKSLYAIYNLLVKAGYARFEDRKFYCQKRNDRYFFAFTSKLTNFTAQYTFESVKEMKEFLLKETQKQRYNKKIKKELK